MASDLVISSQLSNSYRPIEKLPHIEEAPAVPGVMCDLIGALPLAPTGAIISQRENS